MCRECFELWKINKLPNGVSCDDSLNLDDRLDRYRPKEIWQIQYDIASRIIVRTPEIQSYSADRIDDNAGHPGVIDYRRDGTIIAIVHYDTGEISREGGLPARIKYDKQGKEKLVEYWLNGKLHNPYGYAQIARGSSKYFINGVEVPEHGERIAQYKKIFEVLPFPIYEELIEYLDFATIFKIDAPDHPMYEGLNFGL